MMVVLSLLNLLCLLLRSRLVGYPMLAEYSKLIYCTFVRPPPSTEHKGGMLWIRAKLRTICYHTALTSARKISLHPMHPMLLKASGDRNEGRKLKNDNLPKRVS